MSRPYRTNKHLHAIIATESGHISVHPQSADRITFDVAHADSLPANLPSSRNGSSVLDIGRGVQVRLSGYLKLSDSGVWHIPEPWRNLYGSQFPSGGDLTPKMIERATAIIEEAINAWAKTHAGDIAQADDIERNNAARTLEEAIQTHQDALKILRRNLRACENGKAYRQYPELPTKGR